jgi:membrane-associated protease RseP (regulator of RpoE activity)
MAIDLEVYMLIAFFAGVAVWLYAFDRKKVEMKFKVLAIRRWDGGLEHIDRFVKRHRKFVKTMGTVSAVLGIVGGIFGFGYLVFNLFELQQGFALVLPTAGGFEYPGPVFSIPFSSWIIIIFISLAVHESFHAIYARLEGVKVRSYGLVFLVALPVAAFVDPDENQFKRLKSSMSKFRILSAGSFSNLMIGGVVFLLILGTGAVTGAVMESRGVSFLSTIDGTPAHETGLAGTITKINGEEITDVNKLSQVLDGLAPGSAVSVETTEGTYAMTLAAHPDNAEISYMGISGVQNSLHYKALLSGPVSSNVVNLLGSWGRFMILFLAISIGIGIANLLPMKPFDGGHIFEEAFGKVFKNHGPIITKIAAYATLFLLMFNLFGVGLIRDALL